MMGKSKFDSKSGRRPDIPDERVSSLSVLSGEKRLPRRLVDLGSSSHRQDRRATTGTLSASHWSSVGENPVLLALPCLIECCEYIYKNSNEQLVGNVSVT